MANYLLRISFDGLCFQGTQIQPDDRQTIQGVFQRLLSKLFATEIKIRCSSRLDRGVSARDFCFSFRVDSRITPDRILYYLNSQIGKSIRVNSIEKVGDDFDARATPHRKTYLYTIDCGIFDPVLDSHCGVVNHRLDLDLFVRTMNIFIGQHDFKSFASLDSKGDREQNFISIIDRIHITARRGGKIIETRITGRAFHRYQVRMMIGAAIGVASGREKLDEVESRLVNPNIDARKYKAPAEGLCLIRTTYRRGR
ncbi:MAG TPA: hypothetical protein DEA32_02140 [Firmicutes bacterium]|nr:hypothetical protein [Bacillota bacterium]